MSRPLVRTLVTRHAPGFVIPPHAHDWPQLVEASGGLLSVDTLEGAWVVPSRRAVWIPAGLRHSLETSGRVLLRSLYLAPDRSEGLPAHCRVLEASPLLAELVRHAVGLGTVRDDDPSQRLFTDFLVDRLRATKTAAFDLPMPRDPRAVRIARRVREQPGDASDLEALAAASGASRRTAERLFRAETGMAFGRWRQRVRLVHALRLLSDGRSVTEVALEVGYQSPSAFIAVFRRSFGHTPSRHRMEAADDGGSVQP